MKFLKLHSVYMDEANTGGEGGGAGGEQAPADKGTQSPNEGWQDDANLDENGNPKGVNDDAQGEADPQSDKSNKGDGDKQDKDEGDTSGEQDSYSPDMPVVKQIEALIIDAGLTTAEIGAAMLKGDGVLPADIQQKIADKHGDAVGALVADKLKTFHATNKAKATANDNAVYSQVEKAFEGVTEQSGKDSWQELSKWAKDNITVEDRTDINKLIKQGGLAAQYAVQDLVNRFKSSDAFSQDASLESGDNTVKVNGVAPLGRREYSQELRKLTNAGHVYGQSQAIANLDKRREAGLARGM